MDITLAANGESVDLLVLVNMKWRLLKEFRWKILFLGSEFVCPNNKVTTTGQNDATVTKPVGSWSACSNLCRQSDDCTYWTWYTAGSRANECVTMTYHGNLETDNNAVSGDRNCEGNKP